MREQTDFERLISEWAKGYSDTNNILFGNIPAQIQTVVPSKIGSPDRFPVEVYYLCSNPKLLQRERGIFGTDKDYYVITNATN